MDLMLAALFQDCYGHLIYLHVHSLFVFILIRRLILAQIVPSDSSSAVILLTVEPQLCLSTSVTPHIMHTYASFVLHHIASYICIIHHHTYIYITALTSRLVDKRFGIIGFLVPAIAYPIGLFSLHHSSMRLIFIENHPLTTREVLNHLHHYLT